MQRANYWTRPIPRRTLLSGSASAALGATAWALTGCSDNDDAGSSNETPTSGGGRPGTATAPTPTTAGEVVNKTGINKVRQSAIFATINPYGGLDSGLTWGFTIFDHLWYTPLDTGVRENFLATNIEQQDATHFTVTIGESFFHDKAPANGRKVTAQDVKASYESAAKQTKISNSSWWTEVLDTITTPDEKTVNFALKKVDAWTFSSSNGGSPIGSSILPQEIAADPGFMDRDLVGSGRFQFVSHENGTNFKLKRNEKWRVAGEPYLAGVEYKLIQEQAAALAAFSAQEIYSIGFNNRLEREDMEKKHGKDINSEADETRAIWLLMCRGDGQWADPRVPQAFSLALDRKEIINLMNFGEGRISGPVPPAFGEALPEKEILETWGKSDPAEAKKLLAATTFDTSREYSMKYPVLGDRYQQFATIAKSQLEKNLGLKIKLAPEDFGRWLGQSLYGSDFDGFHAFVSLAYDDPTSYVAVYTKTNGGRPNWAGWKNDELDAAVNRQKGILDDAERRKAVQEIQRMAWKAGAPYIPTFVAVASGASWNFVKGRVTGRGSYGGFNGKLYIDKK